MAKKKENYKSVLRKELDEIEYSNQIISNVGEYVPRFSSGCLVNDLVLSGGVPPAMITYSGHEGGGKSTLLNHTLNGAIRAGVKTLVHFDAENSRDPEYVINIYRDLDFGQIYGVPGKKRGEWAIDPLINYYPYSQFERVFGVFRSILKVLPDKIYRKSDSTWYYVFRNKKDEVARMHAMGLKPDKKLSDRKRYWCPTDTEGLQAVFAVDSWVALVLEAEDEMEKDTHGIAAEAREFPKQLRRVCGRLMQKQVALLGANQIRIAPMSRFGNPEYEPGGSALKFWSDIRNGLRPVVPKDGFSRDKEARSLATEKSVMGKGQDHYAFKNLTNIKNKYGRPLLKGTIRIWVSDIYGQAHGIDPVYDTYQYLKMTGQLSGSPKRGMVITHPLLKKQKLKWLEFKEMILIQHFADSKEDKRWRKKFKITKKFNIRSWCEDQLLEGKATELFQIEQSTGTKEATEDLEESSDD